MASFDAHGTDCTRAIEIAIPAQAETLTAFPALIGTPDAAHEFWTTVQADGSDLHFFLADGTALPYEIVAIDTGAKTIECYVRVTCSNSAVTNIYMLWSGSANAGNTPTDTWSGSYHLVYHGQQGAGNWTDSTAGGYTGTNTGVAAGTGKIGVCGDFELGDAGDRIANATAMNWEYTQAFTLSAWINLESSATQMGLITRYNTVGDARGIFANVNHGGTAGRFGLYMSNDNSPVTRINVYGTATLTNGTWRNVCYVNSGAGTAAGISFYAAGAGVATTTIDNTLDSKTIINTAPLNIGAANSVSNWFDGLIDEVRIATVARSANWVAAEYSNTNDAGAWSTQTTVPNIISIDVASGTTAGGTDVVVTGTGFLAALGAGGATFGGTAATDFSAHGWTSFACKTPAHTAGLVSFTFTNGDGHDDTLANCFTFVAPGPPVSGDDLGDLLGVSTLWDIGFDWREDPQRRIELSRDVLELSTSRVTITERTDYLAQEVRYGVTGMTDEETHDLIEFFAGRLGRYRRFWLPVSARKFTILSDAAILQNTLIVSDSNFTEFCQGYERVIIYMSNGDRITRAISSAADNGDGTETLTLTTALARTVVASDIQLCCPLLLVRFASDELSLAHRTAHVAAASVGFVELVREYTSTAES